MCFNNGYTYVVNDKERVTWVSCIIAVVLSGHVTKYLTFVLYGVSILLVTHNNRNDFHLTKITKNVCPFLFFLKRSSYRRMIYGFPHS